MKRNDEYILKRIKPPSKMSVDLSTEDYKTKKLEKVYEYKDMGFSLNDSIDIVNGDMSLNKNTLKKKKKSRKSIVLFTIFIVIIVVCIMYFMRFSPDSTNAVQSDSVNQNIELELSQNETILIVGSDERPEVDKGSGTSKDVPGVRTDVMIMANIPKDGSRMVITSIPRDLNVFRPECYSYDYKTKKVNTSEKVPSQNNVKINSVYEQGGPQCLVKTIENFTDQSITRYAQMNFDDFSTVIDSLGGIEITAKDRVEDEILGTIIPRSGKYILDGNTTLNYARARHVIGTPMSDFDRMKRQQEIIDAALKSIENSMSPKVLMQIITGILPNMTVDNLGVNDVAKLVTKASSINKENIFMNTLPTLEEENIQGNILYDEIEVQNYFISINSKRPIHGQVIKDKDGIEATTLISLPRNIHLIYSGETSENKEILKNYLTQKGVSVSTTKDSRFKYRDSTIYANGRNADEAATIMYILQDAKISTEKVIVEKQDDSDLVIVVGENMSIQDIIPPGEIQVFIPSGVSQVKDILPVFLN